MLNDVRNLETAVKATKKEGGHVQTAISYTLGEPYTIENINNGTYPLTVDLCVITREQNDNPYVQQMVDFMLSEDGQELVEKSGYGRVK